MTRSLSHRTAGRAWLALAAVLTATLGTSTPADAQTPPTCTVERIVDGDTMALLCPGKTRVRLLGIDSPEKDQKPFGPAATAHLARLAPVGTRVRIETDLSPRDRYGRTLAYLYLPNGRMLNEEMARAGYVTALVYPPNVRHAERLRAAVAGARSARRGLWATSAFSCAPRDHRAGRC